MKSNAAWILLTIGMCGGMALLNRWHPRMGLGDVLYFVTCGVILSVQLCKPEKKE